MEDNVFQFFIMQDENTYFYVSPGGVQTTTEETEVKRSVESWEQSTVAIKRSPTYWAAFREYSVPQKFVLDGAKIHRYIFFNSGILGKCIFKVKKLNRTFFTYQDWYSGDFDYSSASDEDYSFSIRVKERGLAALINSRQDTPIEIPLDVPEAIQVKIGGTRVGCSATWILGTTNTALDEPVTWMQGTSVNANPELVMPATNVGLTQITSFIKVADQLTLDTDTFLSFNPAALYNAAFFDTKIFLFATLYDLKNVKVSGSVRLGLVGDTDVPGDYTFRLKLWYGRPNQEGAGSFSQFDLGSGVLSFSAPTYIEIPLSAEFDMPKDRVAFLTINIISAPSGVTNTDELVLATDGSRLDISFQAVLPDTTCKGLRYIDAFKALVSKLTDGQFEGYSAFLSNTSTSPSIRKANYDNNPFDTILSSGNGFRNIPGATIKTTLSEMFKDCWSNWALALSIEGNVVKMEPLAHFFSENIVLHLEHVRNVAVYPWTDKLFNNLKVGYGNYDNSNVVGKNEFNTGTSFLIEANDVFPGEDDLISPYRADVYGIESIRAETFDANKLDNRSDNDTFIVEVDPVPVSGVFVPYRPASVITGVDDPQGIYNVALSPARKLARHLPRIRSFFRVGELRYQSTDKNPELVSDLGSGTIAESGSINLENDYYFPNNTNPVFPLFTQYIISFECSPPYMLAEILATDMSGCISFKYNGQLFKGYVLEVMCSPAGHDTYTFKLLSHKDNDLSKLRDNAD